MTDNGRQFRIIYNAIVVTNDIQHVMHCITAMAIVACIHRRVGLAGLAEWQLLSSPKAILSLPTEPRLRRCHRASWGAHRGRSMNSLTPLGDSRLDSSERGIMPPLEAVGKTIPRAATYIGRTTLRSIAVDSSRVSSPRDVLWPRSRNSRARGRELMHLYVELRVILRSRPRHRLRMSPVQLGQQSRWANNVRQRTTSKGQGRSHRSVHLGHDMSDT